MISLAYQCRDELFSPAYRGLSWPDLLEYYQHKPLDVFFPLSPGKAKHLEKANDVLANRFNLNNESHQLPERFDWQNNPSADLEWLILLHKFYYLKDLACAYDVNQDEKYARKWVDLISSWLEQVPVGFIDTQVTGRRLQQWLASYRYFVGKWKSSSISPDFFADFLHSVNSQALYLCKHLTPEGNHRTLELYAIFMVAVTFPELSAAGYFLEFSKKHLLENMQQDLLADGVHRELSTDYHHTVLKNYLRFRELAELNRIALPAQCDRLLRKALKFSYHVHKPDGFIPAINDGDCNSYLPLLKKANGIYADPQIEYVLTQGERGSAPLQRSVLFQESGYCVLRSEWQSAPYQEAFYLFFDCAQLGFGSHGHYDALSFEAAAYGRSLIVDPGRYTYCETAHEGVNWRQYFKGTAAHNTVTIDGLDQIAYQCECPVEPEPEAHLDFFISEPGFDWVQGRVFSHRYPVNHERSIFFLHAEYWIVTDRLLAETRHGYDLRFHLAPLAQGHIELIENAGTYVVNSPNLLLAQPKQAGVSLAIDQGFVSPEYGIKHPAPVVRFSKEKSTTSLFQTVLYPYKDMPPEINVNRLLVYLDGRVNAVNSATALSLRVNPGFAEFTDIFFINHDADAQIFAFADVRCRCRMLFIRRDSSGKLISLQAEAVDFIELGGQVLVNLHGVGRISFQDGNLTMTHNGSGRSHTWPELDSLPARDVLSAFWREL